MTNREIINILQANAVYTCEKAGLSKAVIKSVEDALDFAISALKKQEPKKPLKTKGCNCKLRSPYSCPECYTEIPPGCEYCWRCGKKIDWSKEKEDE